MWTHAPLETRVTHVADGVATGDALSQVGLRVAAALAQRPAEIVEQVRRQTQKKVGLGRRSAGQRQVRLHHAAEEVGRVISHRR